MPEHPDAEFLLPEVMVGGKSLNLEPPKILRMLRASLRMTVAQLAQRSRIDAAHITRMEAGKVDGQWKTWGRLFEALGCKPVLRIQSERDVKGLLEDRIRLAARQRLARIERLYPDKKLTDAEREAEIREWEEILLGRRTSEIWEEVI